MLSLAVCWAILIVCIASATAGTVCIKASDVYQQIVPSILMFLFFVVAVAGFPFAFSRIDLGTAYAGTLCMGVLKLSVHVDSCSHLHPNLLLLQCGRE